MMTRASWPSAVLSSGLLALAVVGCKAASPDDGGGVGSGATGSGATGSGATGSGAAAGTDGSGATGAGASTGTGGSAGSGATAGTGGAPTEPPELCSLPQDAGACDGYIESYWHDPATGVCEPFIYGGCEGNENRFQSIEACQEACHGGAVDMDACADDTDCTLVLAQCCGCGQQLTEYRAVNVANQEAFQATIECPAVACAPCQQDVTTDGARYMVATCRAGQCVPMDLRSHVTTACDMPEDCKPRYGAGCCPACSGDVDSLLAVSDEVALQDVVCGAGVNCDACAPVYPADYMATCEVTQCVIRPVQ